MKAFIISIILLVLVVAGIFGYAYYSDSVLSTLRTLALDAYENSTSDEVLSRLNDYWERHKGILSLGANLDDIDSVTENIIDMKSSAKSGNTLLFHQSYALLCNAIDDIQRFESLKSGFIF